MNFSIFIRSDALILIPVLYFLGLFLKQTPRLPLWSHAWLQVLFAVISCLLYYGFKIESVVQGILVAGVAVISRDLIHHTIYGINEQKMDVKWDPYKGVFTPKEEEEHKKEDC